MISMNFIVYFSHFCKLIIYLSTNFNKKIRIGGMVKKNSIIISGEEINFIVTDFKNEIKVSYSGTVPNLFSEERGAVVEGKLNDKSYLIADRILAKHDENYMPPEMKKIFENAK